MTAAGRAVRGEGDRGGRRDTVEAEEGERRCTDGASARGSCRKVPASWQQRQLRAVPPWKARL